MADLKADVVRTASCKTDFNVRKCISSNAIRSSEDFYGILIGDATEEQCDIVACIRCTHHENTTEKHVVSSKPDWVKEVAEICTLIPVGLKICGLCFVSKKKIAVESSLVEEIFAEIDIENDLINKIQIFWLVDLASKDSQEETIFVQNLSDKSVQESRMFFEDIKDDFISKHLSLRLRHKLELTIEESIDKDVLVSLSNKTNVFCNKLCDATFYVPACRLLIGSEMTTNTDKTCQEILDDVVTDEKFPQEKHKSNRRSKNKPNDVLDVQVVKPLSKNDDVNNHNHAPVLVCQKEESNYLKFVLAIDVLIMLAVNCRISRLKSLFLRGVKDQLQGIVSCFDTFSKDFTVCIPKVFHFKTSNAPYLMTCAYPWKQSNGEFFDEKNFGTDTLFLLDKYIVSLSLEKENQRSHLLKKLLLPAQRPTLHPNNAYVFKNDRPKDSTYLLNPHTSLTNPGGDGCHVALVDGCYSYHHYMQDNFDDNKWGCAYRSLQTIFSWFRHQGYTDKAIPDHHSIQEALVALGDKQASFIGSKKWIGSFEVHLCLDYFLDVSSKIMAVNTGAELQNKGRELLRHFQTQGTPVMIGGGVLAHTILGVSFNDKTGEIKFLILDPHYTGGEDIKIIIDKGWCGWKNHTFWNQQAHYNLCMPQRPVKV